MTVTINKISYIDISGYISQNDSRILLVTLELFPITLKMKIQEKVPAILQFQQRMTQMDKAMFPL